MTKQAFRWSFLLSVLACLPSTRADQPSQITIPAALPSINLKTISSFNSIFSSWTLEKQSAFRLSRPKPEADDFQTQCFCPYDCECLRLPPKCPPVTMTMTSTATSHVPVPKLATLTGRPAFTTIGRPLTTATSDASAIADQDEDPSALNPHLARPLKDITSTFYRKALHGDHPLAIPLIIKPTEQSNPLTIIAYAQTNLYSNFITNALVHTLGLDSNITTFTFDPIFTPERNISRILNYPAKILGRIKLDVLAGECDYEVDDMEFVVVTEAEADGKYRYDCLVGTGFLNKVGALRLSESFTGTKAGAKIGLPIIVRPVFADGASGSVGAGHDEL